MLVEASGRDAFLGRMLAYTDEHVLGDSRAAETTVSPLIHPDHLARVHGFVERARAARDRAQRVGRAVRAGTVWVNCFLIRDLTAPFGGCGISGIGREGGDYALDFHSDLKTLQILEGSTG